MLITSSQVIRHLPPDQVKRVKFFLIIKFFTRRHAHRGSAITLNKQRTCSFPDVIFLHLYRCLNTNYLSVTGFVSGITSPHSGDSSLQLKENSPEGLRPILLLLRKFQFSVIPIFLFFCITAWLPSAFFPGSIAFQTFLVFLFRPGVYSLL